MPYADVGGGIDICGGYGRGIEDGAGGWYVLPAFGGGGKLLLLCGIGTAPGCGAGGLSSSVFVVGVGCTGTYCCAAVVGAGAVAPGRADGYEDVDVDVAVVIAGAGFCGSGVV